MPTRLEQVYPESVRVISLKFFGGVTNNEIANMDGVAERRLDRHWASAKTRIYGMIQKETGNDAGN
jgi:hypothetical protein